MSGCTEFLREAIILADGLKALGITVNTVEDYINSAPLNGVDIAKLL